MMARSLVVIADGRALFLDPETKQPLERRRFIDGEIQVRMDAEQPITLKRLAEIAERFGIKRQIRLNDSRYYDADDGHEISEPEMISDYAGGEEGGYRTKTKEYVYDVAANSLLIFDEGIPVYANDNGVVCRDQAAIADTLYD